MEYTKPELGIIDFGNCDIITTSQQGAGEPFHGGSGGDMNNGYVDNIFNP